MASTGVNSLSFNNDFGCFSCASEKGLRIYNVEPLTQKLFLGVETVGSIMLSEMLHRTNLVAMVGGGTMPKFAENTVLIWDDSRKSFVLELTFSSQVVAAKMKRNRIIVVLVDKIYVYNFPNNPKNLCNITTRKNLRGLCDISSAIGIDVLVCPGMQCGTLQIMDLITESASSTRSIINAHKGELACIAINNEGTLVATASEKGTLIRIFDIQRGGSKALLELRRGADPANIYCINFSPDSHFMCVSSDKGTVHIFAVKESKLNKRSKFQKMGFLGQVGQYVESQWGLTNFTVPAECACICAFGPCNSGGKSAQEWGRSVYAVCVDGTFHKYIFNPDGNCNREAFDVFLDIGNDIDF